MATPRRTSDFSTSISERLSDRLAIARAAFDRRFNAQPPNRRPTARRLPSLAEHDSGTLAVRERSVLRAVFLEMGEAHRQYRYRTGKSGTPELRAAAHAFKDAPSERSLLPVATMLDDLKLLGW